MMVIVKTSLTGISGLSSIPPLSVVAPGPMTSIPVVGMSPPLVSSVPTAAVPPVANGAPAVIQPLPAYGHPGMLNYQHLGFQSLYIFYFIFKRKVICVLK